MKVVETKLWHVISVRIFYPKRALSWLLGVQRVLKIYELSDKLVASI